MELRIEPRASDSNSVTDTETLFAGSLAFAATGAVLALMIGLLLRRFTPGVGRSAFIVTGVLGALGLAVLIVALIGWQVDGAFSFGFLARMSWEAWVMFSALAIAALLVARRLAPMRQARTDPSVFD